MIVHGCAHAPVFTMNSIWKVTSFQSHRILKVATTTDQFIDQSVWAVDGIHISSTFGFAHQIVYSLNPMPRARQRSITRVAAISISAPHVSAPSAIVMGYTACSNLNDIHIRRNCAPQPSAHLWMSACVFYSLWVNLANKCRRLCLHENEPCYWISR